MLLNIKLGYFSSRSNIVWVPGMGSIAKKVHCCLCGDRVCYLLLSLMYSLLKKEEETGKTKQAQIEQTYEKH